MTVTVKQFRQNFPAFADPERFPDDFLQFNLDFAYVMLVKCRWGSTLDMAAQLYTAHWSSIERRAMDEADAGGSPGTAAGPVSSKGVGPANVSYDPNLSGEEGKGHWNLTTYGQRLYRMIRMFGGGMVLVGAPGPSPAFSGGAWSGPPFWPGWYGNT